MELGERLRRARTEAGLSQRQLCEGIVTRNMLSLIENGSARPSMDTLLAFAARLGKPVGYFLEEAAVLPVNQAVMDRARQHYDEGGWAQALEALAAYRGPDPVYDRERTLLEALATLALAEQAADTGREIYARQLLKTITAEPAYFPGEFRRRCLLLRARLGERVCDGLPSLDEELLLRAGEALEAGAPERAGKLLDAAENQSGGSWRLLRGKIYIRQGRYRQAIKSLHKAAESLTEETAPLLELCYRELGDYAQAYRYACMQKKDPR